MRQYVHDGRRRWLLAAAASGLGAALSYWAFIPLVPLFVLPVALFLKGRARLAALAASAGAFSTPYLWLDPEQFLGQLALRTRAVPSVENPWAEGRSLAFNLGFADRWDQVTPEQTSAMAIGLVLTLVGLYRLSRIQCWELALPAIMSLLLLGYAYLTTDEYLTLRYSVTYQVFLSLPLAVGMTWLPRGACKIVGRAGPVLAIAFVATLVAERFLSSALEVARENKLGFDRSFIAALDRLAETQEGPIVLLSSGGTSHTEFIGARLHTWSYDLGKLYGQYFRYDRGQGLLPDTLTAVYYDRGIAAVWLDSWTRTDLDIRTITGARLIIGKMPVESLYQASLSREQ
jgi:hypothetical protein